MSDSWTMTDADGRAFGIDIVASRRLGDLWIYYCFPYYMPKGESSPPYPGFECLKIWLTLNFPSAAYDVTTKHPATKQNWATLEVTFNNQEEAMLFRLMCS
jgi:hypothetical protein